MVVYFKQVFKLVNISYVHMVIFDGAYVYQQIVKGRS